MTTRRPGLHVAGIAVTSGDWPGTLLPLRAANAALDDAGLGPSDLTAVIHVGDRAAAGIATAVRDGIGASSLVRTFDVDGGSAGFVSALAVGASLLAGGSAVLITDAEQEGAASVVLTAGEHSTRPPGAHDPLVVRSVSPVRALLDSRTGGHDDVVLVAPGFDGASVRCLFD